MTDRIRARPKLFRQILADDGNGRGACGLGLVAVKLPPAPPTQTGPVKAWAEPVVLPTYAPAPADTNPMFLEKRVYQGSSGRVYPNPFTDRVALEKKDQTYRAIMLENEYVQLMMLPEIGGRIHEKNGEADTHAPERDGSRYCRGSHVLCNRSAIYYRPGAGGGWRAGAVKI